MRLMFSRRFGLPRRRRFYHSQSSLLDELSQRGFVQDITRLAFLFTCAVVLTLQQTRRPWDCPAEPTTHRLRRNRSDCEIATYRPSHSVYLFASLPSPWSSDYPAGEHPSTSSSRHVNIHFRNRLVVQRDVSEIHLVDYRNVSPLISSRWKITSLV